MVANDLSIMMDKAEMRPPGLSLRHDWPLLLQIESE